MSAKQILKDAATHMSMVGKATGAYSQSRGDLPEELKPVCALGAINRAAGLNANGTYPANAIVNQDDRMTAIIALSNVVYPVLIAHWSDRSDTETVVKGLLKAAQSTNN